MNLIVHENNSEHYPCFIALNEAWIKREFGLEEADHRLARDPAAKVAAGGAIFTGEVDGQVVGCCALFVLEDGQVELARMAVDPAWQRRGYARQLLRHALAGAVARGYRRIVLYSNRKLGSALALYRAEGFTELERGCGGGPTYARCDIIMEKVLP